MLSARALFCAFVCLAGLPSNEQQLRKMNVTPGVETYLSGDARVIAVASIYFRPKDIGTVALHDFTTGELLSTIDHANAPLSISGNHQRLLAMNGENEYCLYNLADIRHPQLMTRQPLDKELKSVALSPDGQYYALGFDNGQLAVLSTETGKTQYVYNTFSPPHSTLNEVQFTADNNLILYNYDKGYIVFDPRRGSTLWSINYSESNKGTTSSFSPAANQLMVGRQTADGYVYDMKTGNILKNFLIPGNDRSRFTADGRLGIDVDRDALVVYKNNPKRKKAGAFKLKDYGLEGTRLNNVLYSEDNKWFVAALNGGNLLIGNLEEIEDRWAIEKPAEQPAVNYSNTPATGSGNAAGSTQGNAITTGQMAAPTVGTVAVVYTSGSKQYCYFVEVHSLKNYSTKELEQAAQSHVSGQRNVNALSFRSATFISGASGISVRQQYLAQNNAAVSEVMNLIL